MKAILIDRPGGPDVLRLGDAPEPTPKAGEAVVAPDAIGVNFIDVYFRTGVYPSPHLPFVPGMEAAGVVTTVGDGVDQFKPGDRVAFAMGLGSYAERVAVSAQRLVRVPDAVTSRDAAALMLQGMTAHYLTNSTFPLAPGQTALVHAGAGGVGLLLTQLAKAKGATVITTVSTEEKAKLSRDAGADHVINYLESDFLEETRRITDGAGVHVVYDSVGKTTWEKGLQALRPRGMFVLFGASSGAPPPIEFQLLNQRGSLFVTRPSLAHYTQTPDEIAWRASELFASVENGTLKLLIEHEYPLGDAARAHEDLESRKTVGKLLLFP